MVFRRFYVPGKIGNGMHFSGGQIAYVGGQNWVNNLAQTNPVPQNLNAWTASVWVNYSSAQDGSWLPVFGTNWYSPNNGTLLMFNPSSNGQVNPELGDRHHRPQIVGNWEDIFDQCPPTSGTCSPRRSRPASTTCTSTAWTWTR